MLELRIAVSNTNAAAARARPARYQRARARNRLLRATESPERAGGRPRPRTPQYRRLVARDRSRRGSDRADGELRHVRQEYGDLLRSDPIYAEKAQRVSMLARDLAEVIAAEPLDALAGRRHAASRCIAVHAAARAASAARSSAS